jgi:hypothetical protein
MFLAKDIMCMVSGSNMGRRQATQPRVKLDLAALEGQNRDFWEREFRVMCRKG